MLQCQECEFFSRDENTGQMALRCDPFSTIKEPACLEKWQLLKMDALLRSYHAMLAWYQRFSPMQEKMFKMINREIDDMEDADSWKYDDKDTEQGDDDPEDYR